MSQSSLELALQTLAHLVGNSTELTDAAGRIAFMHALPHDGLAHLGDKLECEQAFKPRNKRLRAAGFRVVDSLSATYPIVLLLPERQRQQTFADLARAHDLLEDEGVLIVATHNDWGAKRWEKHVNEAGGATQHLTKWHCRAFWTKKTARWNTAMLEEWRGQADLQRVIDGQFWSKPGLFAWDHIDPGSAMLIECLPPGIHGAVADLGAGWGYLSQHLLRTRPEIRELDAFEADRDGVEAARRNLKNAQAQARSQALWYDVTEGIQPRHYDFIVMNPPFHDGREADSTLGMKFIGAASQGLRTAGQLWMVANRHLPYEAILEEVFDEVIKVREENGYKVLTARAPRQERFTRTRRR